MLLVESISPTAYLHGRKGRAIAADGIHDEVEARRKTAGVLGCVRPQRELGSVGRRLFERARVQLGVDRVADKDCTSVSF
jgi:hypothetical protein